MKLFIYNILFILFIGCGKKNKMITSEREYYFASPGGSVYSKMRGELKDSLENGTWVFFDSVNNTVEKGDFQMGVRTGTWNYDIPGFGDTSISWQEFRNPGLKLITNIPSSFKETEIGDSYVRLDQSQVSGKFTIVFFDHDLRNINISVDSFYKVADEELESKGWRLKYDRYKFSISQKEFYLTRYDLMGEANLKMWDMYININGKIFEISITVDATYDLIGSKIFNSIASNLFINSKRMISPFDKVEKIIALP